MTQRERDAHVWMRNNVKAPGDRLTRVENLVMPGTPDTNGCFNGTEFWMEIKGPKETSRMSSILFRNNSNHKFSQDQKNWAHAHIRAGGNMWAYLYTDRRKMLIPGGFIEHLNDMPLGDIIAAAVWHHHMGEPIQPKASELRFLLTQPTPCVTKQLLTSTRLIA